MRGIHRRDQVKAIVSLQQREFARIFRIWRRHAGISPLQLRLECRVELVFKTTSGEKFRYTPEII
ncbi:hypothetical protein ABW45_12710 [Stenotrophomonas maltophilia]|nr:hypothetical protein ABW45_12710 [Stenotrophomonas maltophilia]